MNEAVWNVAPPSETADPLASALGLPPVIGRILANRGIVDEASARLFLEGDLADAPDPFLFNGMAAAVDRIQRAVAGGEPILIFGDYDVDGVLATVMLHKALTTLGGKAGYFIPERLKDGYGIKDEHVSVAVERGAKLVISVDCGIKSNGFVKSARAAGVDVIVTDHHLPGPELPEALAVLDPVVEGSGYPDRSLAGVGVAFKLIQALFQTTGRASVLPHYLKLVAIGTVADIVDLRGENRIFVRRGLRELRNVSNPGLRSLMAVCGLAGKPVSVGDIGFRLGPRINAAGRMGRTDLALRLFFSDSAAETTAVAMELDDLNRKRQAAEEAILAQAEDRIRSKGFDRDYKILILGDEKWHRGVVGIVASRLREAFSRPVILFSYENGIAFGSGRSVPAFSLIDCLESARPLYLSYGGHRQAVGCTLRRESMPAFKEAMNREAEERLSPEDLKPSISIDARLDFAEVDERLWSGLALLEPHGVGNPRPVFLTEGAEVAAPPRLLKERHVKLMLRQAGRTFEAIGWNRGEWAGHFPLGSRVDCAYTFQTSSYLGEDRLYLGLEGLRPA
ncbi:MAG: single-stranded-DNA-specific exonuclease RecJ [Candidatus Aminicenantes bacterium]|nr:single-stranded-DNA-specific exonuclease RecJ [Candidatus Aminicenantes bacterium]